MKRVLWVVLLFVWLSGGSLYAKDLAVAPLSDTTHPVLALVGEHLSYDISFLWFDRLAEGSIELSKGDKPGTFLVVMQARTLGVAAFFTRDRVERYETLMEVAPQGYLRPLWHSSHTIRGSKDNRKEKTTKLTFDYTAGKVRYQKQKNGKVYAEQIFELEKGKPEFDILTALYNLRLGVFGPLSMRKIAIPTFHRQGPQDIIVEPLTGLNREDAKFFSKDPIQCRILVDPSVFGTKGRDIFASFDAAMRPRRGIIKNVIGLGDVRGMLRPN